MCRALLTGQEKRSLCVNLLPQVMHMREFVLYSYGDNVVNQTSLRTSFNTNKGYKGLTHPCVETEGGYAPDFGHRCMLPVYALILCLREL